MIRTRVGYAGGSSKNPTYHNLGDHTETVQIEFDPAKVSYRELLDVFWKDHDPTRRSWSAQYKAAVFYHDEEQRRIAVETAGQVAQSIGSAVRTEILPFSGFTLAEDYHQKHRLRGNPELIREFRAVYPDDRGFINSTAAARVNGFLDGYGTAELLLREVESYGISTRGKEILLDRVKGARALSRSCPL